MSATATRQPGPTRETSSDEDVHHGRNHLSQEEGGGGGSTGEGERAGDSAGTVVDGGGGGGGAGDGTENDVSDQNEDSGGALSVGTYVEAMLEEGMELGATGVGTAVGVMVLVWTQVVGTHEVWVIMVTELPAGGAGAGAELMTGAGLLVTAGALLTTGVVPAGVLVAATPEEAGQLETVGPHEVMVTSSVE